MRPTDMRKMLMKDSELMLVGGRMCLPLTDTIRQQP